MAASLVVEMDGQQAASTGLSRLDATMGAIGIADAAGFGPAGLGRTLKYDLPIVRQQQMVHEDVVVAAT